MNPGLAHIVVLGDNDRPPEVAAAGESEHPAVAQLHHARVVAFNIAFAALPGHSLVVTVPKSRPAVGDKRDCPVVRSEYRP